MEKTELAAKVKNVAYIEGDFVLRSGKRSNYYIDKYRFSSRPEILAEFGKKMAEFTDGAEVVAGPELGAVALAAAVSMESGIPMAIVRKSRKEHGTAKLIEGEPVKGKKVLLVEDVGTTAGAALSAAETLEKAGAGITRLVFALDRMEGARENVEKAGYEFHAILNTEDLGIR